MIQTSPALPKSAQVLGLAGLLPQIICCGLALTGNTYGMFAFVSGFAYAALIFSFVGGVWWGQALQAPKWHPWIFLASVIPSLISWAAAILLFSDLKWWPYATAAIAIGLMVSPLVDLQIGKLLPQPKRWMQLRWTLSIGLGVLTLVLATFTLRAV